MNKIKRCLVLEDYSALGRCSITVALPILSSMGIETVALPTSVLSNHTAFDQWVIKDLTKLMLDATSLYKKYNENFDCIYLGYMEDTQIDNAIKIINSLKKEDTLIVVDPAFADNGKIYKCFSNSHINKLHELIKLSDYITPNLTEAYLLINKDINNDHLSNEDLINGLIKLGVKNIIITDSQIDDPKKVKDILYINKDEKIEENIHPHFDLKIHGAGDVFTSVFTGCLLNNLDAICSLHIASKFCKECMEYAISYSLDTLHYGLPIEPNLYKLHQYLSEKL